MRYRIFPPGNYNFWRIAAYGAFVRWFLSLLLCVLSIALWYFCIHNPLQTLCIPSATTNTISAQLIAELAERPAESTDTAIQLCDGTTATLTLLRILEQAPLVVQSYNCRKPATKNNLTTQQISCICSGTMTHLAHFFKLLEKSALICTTLETTVKVQHQALYMITITCEIIIADQ